MRRNSNKMPWQEAKEAFDEQGICFDREIEWSVENGFCISTPNLFATGHFFEEDGKKCVWINSCVGDMYALFRFGLNYALDFIEFQRNFSGKTKRYDFKRFTERICMYVEH